MNTLTDKDLNREIDTRWMGASLSGLGHYLPPTTITNHDLGKMVDTSDEWISSRTGIRSRRRAGALQATSDLAVEAARGALAEANLAIDEIDMILLATATPDTPVPATASLVQEALGASGAGAMDLNAGCSGFLYGLHTAGAFVRSGYSQNVLLIGAETLTRVTDYSDRQTCILFGDGAGACVVSSQGQMDVLYSGIGSDGSQAELIQIQAGGSRSPASADTVAAHQHYLQLDGRRVFRQAVTRMAEAANTALEETGLKASDVSWLIPHQANERIMSAVAELVGIAVPQIVNDIAETGNTSAASVPIAMDRARQAGAFKDGDLIMLVAFGAGLTWACQILRYNEG